MTLLPIAALSFESAIIFAILLFVMGLVFIVAELFFVSFGVLTLCSISSFIASLYLAFGASTAVGVVLSVLLVIGVPTLVIVGIRLLPHTAWGSKIISGGPKHEDVVASGVPQLNDLVGKKGVTLTVCRPAGAALINEKRYDVVSEGLNIPRERPVQVVGVEGNRVVVRELDVEDMERTE